MIRILILLLVSATAYAQTPEAYFEKYRPIAVEIEHEYGIPVCITLAQAALESGYGSSLLACAHNNHFGIRTRRGYRRYENAEASFRHYAVVLCLRRYRSLFLIPVTDYKGWAHGLKRCGYAEDEAYAEKLIWIIERYNLCFRTQ